jgi:GNAT superfamily N-acetyltransferase
MPAPDHLALARHIDRVRRFVLSNRPGIAMHEIPRGWMSVDTTEPCEEFPFNNPNRVGWFALDSPPTTDDINGTLDVLRALSRPRIFFWIGPGGWSNDLDALLAAHGAHRWPVVQYPLLFREAGECPAPRVCNFDIRRVTPDQAPAVLADAEAWYSKKGTQTALRLVQQGRVDMHAAYDGPRAVALAVIIMDAPFAYLGWAVTAPDMRKQGAQTALIAARVQRAAALGANWCVCETATAEMTSTNNLKRCGFEEAFGWRVYRWDDPPRA